MSNVIVGMLLGSCGQGGKEVVMFDKGDGESVFGRLFGYVLLWWVCFITRSDIWLYMSVKASFMSTKIRWTNGMYV
jgi:hypothetical protein